MRARLDRLLAGLRRWRDGDPRRRFVFRLVVGLLGGLVTALGIALIPYPGPGWLVVFAGLGILATEFAWARRVLEFARDKYDRWEAWMGRQNWFVRILVLGVLFVLVLVVLWLIGVFPLVGGWLGLRQEWLRSPIFS